ncbi:MAG TPA: ATP synthase F1 subunit gamma [Candidatus Paceibacterota bacterium]
MAGLKQIKLKIRSVQKTGTVTKAMEAVSAVKMRKAQQRALAGRAYARAATATLARVCGTRALATHPLTQGHPEGIRRALYIVITSDKGLAGGLNSGVLRAASRDIAERKLSTSQVSVIAIGRKANEFFINRGYTVEDYRPNTDAISTELIERVVTEAGNRFASGVVDVVYIVYQNFISTFEQRPTLRTIYPLSLAELSKVVADIVPAKGAYADQVDTMAPAAYTIEPSEEEVLNVILPKLAGIFVYHALLESQASDHSARMVAMKGATDKAKELTHSLTLKFNKARQAAITREVSEITGGMEAMSV